MTRHLWRLPWFVSPPRIVPYLTPSPPTFHLLPPSSPPYVVPVWPADVSGLTNALTARLTLIYFLWNQGAEGNNTEWHYLFIKSRPACLGRVKMWWLDTCAPLAAHTYDLSSFPPRFFDCALIRRSDLLFNLLILEIWRNKEERK